VAQVERQWSAELGERRYAALRDAVVAVARR